MAEEMQTIRPEGGPTSPDRTQEFLKNARLVAARGRVLGAQGRSLHGQAPEGSGDGALRDLGAPLIGLAVAALGPVTQVYAAGDEYVQVTLVHESGARTQLAFSDAVRSFHPIQGLDVYSTAGTVSWSGAEGGQVGDPGDIATHAADATNVLDAAVRSQESGQPVDL